MGAVYNEKYPSKYNFLTVNFLYVTYRSSHTYLLTNFNPLHNKAHYVNIRDVLDGL